MGRNKLDKFKDNTLRDNIVEEGKSKYEIIKGKWAELQFRNGNPIVLELACGKGDYTVGMARQFPGMNFIGIDIKGSRIWTGSLIAEQEDLGNAAFLRTHILKLEKFFKEDEIHAIWITFPDPRPRQRDIRRRLTHPRYLNIYRKILCPSGWVYLKTDNLEFFRYTLDTIEEMNDVQDLEWTEDLYASGLDGDHHGLKTNYEKKFLEQGITIKYLKFRFKK
ncbi:MAG TPA: tRNA (guanosine(46)-N7)-methyltransferase TrmB [Cyclobacteriaceae bacterium]|nr:tRNA (guanosine(46)-N7)-methyltransferase TrmB [Cyclobacteriaceae bacterium]